MVALDREDQAVVDVSLFVVAEQPAEVDPELLLRGAAAVFDADGLPLEAAVARHHLGVHFLRAGDRSRALEALEQASRSYAAIDHDWGVATVEMTLSAAHAGKGANDVARSQLEVALAGLAADQDVFTLLGARRAALFAQQPDATATVTAP